MNPELQNALAELCKKLGTSIEHVYPILVAQAKLNALLCGCGEGLLACCLLGLAINFYIRARKEESEPEGYYMGIALCSLLIILLGAFAISAVSRYVYPEAAVIHHLLGR